MFRRVADFEKTWAYESEQTLRVLRALTDASLSQRVAPADRTLGRIAWHLAGTIGEMMGRTGLAVEGPAPEAPPLSTAAGIAAAYQRAADSLLAALQAAGWTDETLRVEDEMYGERWPRGVTLFALVAHQAHHRGQMTVLMRQAGLPVPGVYGPARDEWASMGMQPPEV